MPSSSGAAALLTGTGLAFPGTGLSRPFSGVSLLSGNACISLIGLSMEMGTGLSLPVGLLTETGATAALCDRISSSIVKSQYGFKKLTKKNTLNR